MKSIAINTTNTTNPSTLKLMAPTCLRIGLSPIFSSELIIRFPFELTLLKMPCSGREISFPYAAQRAQRDGQGTGEEEAPASGSKLGSAGRRRYRRRQPERHCHRSLRGCDELRLRVPGGTPPRHGACRSLYVVG